MHLINHVVVEDEDLDVDILIQTRGILGSRRQRVSAGVIGAAVIGSTLPPAPE